ncbi:hypothetical protein [Hippea maritima]|uniref:Regulatory protein, FmdB family n=1 Tax=Hippea maritima (strain ATCC 700847 / DSM 10411 / MH2) TaxID=760142 RepID=F2LUR8_HIPMA|nr:hypothetical protein [Hippea maritima]AEA33523.1 protein of unknown function DUF134 [Hippea maritima DSM 10411]
MNRKFKCTDCGAEFEEPFGTGRPVCPKCGSDNVFRIDEYAGMGRGQGRGLGRGMGKGLGKGMGRGLGRGRF